RHRRRAPVPRPGPDRRRFGRPPGANGAATTVEPVRWPPRAPAPALPDPTATTAGRGHGAPATPRSAPSSRGVRACREEGERPRDLLGRATVMTVDHLSGRHPPPVP